VVVTGDAGMGSIEIDKAATAALRAGRLGAP
jgi:hypothetical protein